MKITLTRKHFSLLSFVLPLLIILIADRLRPLDVSFFRRPELESAIERYIDAGNFGYTGSGIAEPANSSHPEVGYELIYAQGILRILKNDYHKQFNAVRFNQPIKDDAINIYMVEKDPERLFVDFKNNCAYTGYRNTIICDLEYVRNLQNDNWNTIKPDDLTSVGWTKDSTGTLRPPESLGDSMPQTKEAMVELFNKLARAKGMSIIFWILGHEIGHLAHEHSNRHYAFKDESTAVLINNARGQPSTQELEADEFAVKAAGNGSIATWFYWTLNSFIARAGKKFLNGADPFDLSCYDKLVVRSESATHPPLFLRAVEMCIRLNEAYNLESMKRCEGIKSRIVVTQ